MRCAFVLFLAADVLIATAAGAHGQLGQTACHGALRPRAVAELLLGRDIGRRLGVSEAAFSRFVADEVTPRFPDGLTITDTVGEWRDRGSGRIVRERSKHVEIVLPGKDDDQARLEAIAGTYKRNFRQQSVGIIVRSACVSF